MIAIVLGTRPEIVKMSPIVRACERRELLQAPGTELIAGFKFSGKHSRRRS
jgi:hypothetical protein